MKAFQEDLSDRSLLDKACEEKTPPEKSRNEDDKSKNNSAMLKIEAENQQPLFENDEHSLGSSSIELLEKTQARNHQSRETGAFQIPKFNLKVEALRDDFESSSSESSKSE